MTNEIKHEETLTTRLAPTSHWITIEFSSFLSSLGTTSDSLLHQVSMIADASGVINLCHQNLTHEKCEDNNMI
jgi:hypothetical protein